MRIFLSYGHDENALLAERIKQDLEKKGHQVWFDSTKLTAGCDWDRYIEEGINWVSEKPAEGRIVLLMTPHSVRRPKGFCLNEIALALTRNLDVIPIMVVWCEPPLSICRIQWLDMQDCVPLEKQEEKYEAKFQRLLEALEQNKLDFEGTQSRLIHTLEPLSFEADIALQLRRFTGRQWIIKEIDEWLADPAAERIFWLVGKPGVGKTTLSAWLCHNRPEIVAFHLCKYGHDYKSDPRRCVLSIAYQLSSQLQDYQDRLSSMNLESIVKNSDAHTLFDMLIVQPLSKNFPAPGKPKVILIDALDESTKGNVNDLASFLSTDFNKTPEWLRLIITSRPDVEIIRPLAGVKPHVLDSQDKANEADIKSFIQKELKKFFKDGPVPDKFINVLLEKSEGLFLYVTWVIDELEKGRLHIENIDEFPHGMSNIYTDFFNRQFPLDTSKIKSSHGLDFYKQYCRPALEAIFASCEPIDVDYLSKVLGWDDYKKDEVLDSFGSLFTIINGQIQPFHRSLIQWLVDKDKKYDPQYRISIIEGHKRLVNFGLSEFSKGLKFLSTYSFSYLPVHLLKTEKYDELLNVLRDTGYFQARWNKNEFDVKRLISLIESESPLTVLDVYGDVINDPKKYDNGFLSEIAGLLTDTGHPDASASILKFLVESFSHDEDLESLQGAIGNLGWSRYVTGQLNDALELYIKQEGICRKISYLPGLQMALGLQGNISYHKKDLTHALELYKEQEKICRDIRNKNWLQISLGNQGNVYYDLGEFVKARALYEEKERICGEISNQQGLCVTYGNQGNVYFKLGDMDRALELYQKEESLASQIGFKNGLQSSLGSQAHLYWQKKDAKKALELLHKQESICREINNQESLFRCLYNQSFIYGEIGDPASAIELYDEQESIAVKLNNNILKLYAIGGQPDIRFKMGNIGRALYDYQRLETLSRELNDMEMLHKSLNGQGMVHEVRGEWENAMRSYREKESISKRIGDKFGIQYAILNQADIYYKMGALDTAYQLYEDGEAICHEINNKQGLEYAICFKADILYERGEWAKALELYNAHQNVCMELNKLADYGRSMGLQADIYFKKGDLEISRGLYEKQSNLYLLTKDYGSFYFALLKRAFLYDIIGDQENIAKMLNMRSGLSSMFDQGGWFTKILMNQNIVHQFRDDISTIYDLSLEHGRLLQANGLNDPMCLDHSLISSPMAEFLSDSLEIFQEMERLSRAMGYQMCLQYALGNQGIILLSKGRFEESLKRFEEQENICEKIGYSDGLQLSLGRQARVKHFQKELEKALALLEKQETICRKIGNIESWQACLYNRAMIFYDTEAYDKALMALKAQEELCMKIGSNVYLQFSLSQQGLVYLKLRDHARALSSFEGQETICRQIGYKRGLEFSIYYQEYVKKKSES